MGGSPRALGKIFPNFIVGAAWTGLGTLFYIWLLSREVLADPIGNSMLALSVALFVTLGVLAWAMRFGWPFANEALPLFLGATLLLAVQFTGKAWPPGDRPLPRGGPGDRDDGRGGRVRRPPGAGSTR